MKPTARLIVAFLIFSLTAVAFAQQNRRTPKSPDPQTPEDRDRKVKKEPNNAYERWLKEDVSLIITPAEQRAFEKLKTNEERERFIQIFWNDRDPSPDTEENEYRDEHYQRIAYANEHFSSGKPGWMTDRGRIYVRFGKPDEVESYPAGGRYDRPANEGGGSTTTYPFEKWFYRHLPGVSSGVEIEFVDATGSGEYRIARDFNEKNALAHVPGNASVDPIANSAYLRPEDSPLGRITLLAKLDSAPEFERKFPGGGLTPGPVIDDSALNLEVRADFFKLADDRVITAFTVQTENKDLVFADRGGLLTARLNIYGRIVGVAQQRVGSFEDAVTTTAMPSELNDAMDRRSAYSKVTVLQPGNYRLDVAVRDVASGATGISHLGFQVPKYDDGKLSTSSLILAAKLEKLDGQSSYGQFVIGDTKVIPNLAGVYRRGQSVGVYLQLYNSGIDQTTLRPAVDVEYVLTKGGKEITRQVEDWKGADQTSNRLILARLLATNTLAVGEYQIEIRVHDRVSGQSLKQSAKFTVQ